MNFIEELRWRNILHDHIPGTEEYLNEHPTRGYIGFDPTSDSLHIGNLATIMLLKFFQEAGHTPVALVGGATGMVGDPSGRSTERNLLDEEQLRHNASCIHAQLEKFLDFDPNRSNAAIMVNNYDWFKDISFLDFLRDTGKLITINYMMAKESVKKRIQGDTGISYTEFAYQLLQGYDFLHLYEHHDVRMQMGGSDQWGNLVTGTDLIRKKLGRGAKAFAVTCPLVTTSDGKKFGKSATGQNFWLDANKTSPYELYQYFRQSSDSDAAKYIKVFSMKGREEIEALLLQHTEDPGRGELQKALASEVTERVHDKGALENALMLTDFLFGRNTQPDDLRRLAPSQWEEVVKNAETKQLPKSELESGIGILDILVKLGITQSKGEARRSIEKDKSVRVNAERWESIEENLTLEHAFHGKYLQLQRGKKKKFIVELI